MPHFHKLSKLIPQVLVIVLCFFWVCEKAILPYQDMEAQELALESEAGERDVLALEDLSEADPDICVLYGFRYKSTNNSYFHSETAALPLSVHREDFSPPPESI